MGAGGIKKLIFGVWCASIAAVGLAIYHQDRFFMVKKRAIAVLGSKSGAILVRPAGEVRWQETVDRQVLNDGDLVAAGQESSAGVDFGDGNTLQLAEEAQVQITAISRNNGKDFAFVVKLLRGAVIAQSQNRTCTDCPSLILRAGDKTVNLTQGRSVGLAKAIGDEGAITRFDPKTQPPPPIVVGPRPTMLQMPRELLTLSAAVPPSKAPKEVAEPPAPPVRKPVPPPAPPLKAKGLEVRLGVPAVGSTIWTIKPVMAIANEIIEVPITLAREGDERARIRGLVEISGRAAPEVQEVTGTAARISVAKMRAIGRVSGSGVAKSYEVQVRGGVEVAQGTRSERSFSGSKLLLKLVTLGEPDAGPMTVALDRLAPSTATATWMSPKEALAVEGSPILVRLPSTADYGKLQNIVLGSRSIGGDRVGPGSGSGIFVVRNHAVVAELGGTALDEAAIRQLLEVLGGDVVFKGSRAAFYDAREQKPGEQAAWANDLLETGQSLYILKRDKLYPVNREFAKSSADVAAFIDAQARALFVEKVEILAWR